MSISKVPCAHSATEHLFQSPFCSSQSTIKKVAAVAFHLITLCIPLIIYMIANGISGVINNVQKLPSKSNTKAPISQTKKNPFAIEKTWPSFDVKKAVGITVNQGRLSAAPQNVDLAEIEKIATSTRVQLTDLKPLWDSLTVGVANRNQMWDEINSNLIQPNVHGGKEKDYLKSMHSTLKAIIVELQKPIEGDDDSQKRKGVLINLVSEADQCIPRRLQATLNAFRDLNCKIAMPEQIILQYLQQLKEDLIVNYYDASTQPVHVLNNIRKQVGKELGLDQHPMHINDMFIRCGREAKHYITRGSKYGYGERIESHTMDQQFIDTFHKLYTPANILSLMKETLNNKMATDPTYKCILGLFVSDALDEYPLSSKEKDRCPAPYLDENYLFTDEGIKFLLVHFKFLNTTIPGDHIVRQP